MNHHQNSSETKVINSTKYQFPVQRQGQTTPRNHSASVQRSPSCPRRPARSGSPSRRRGREGPRRPEYRPGRGGRVALLSAGAGRREQAAAAGPSAASLPEESRPAVGPGRGLPAGWGGGQGGEAPLVVKGGAGGSAGKLLEAKRGVPRPEEARRKPTPPPPSPPAGRRAARRGTRARPGRWSKWLSVLVAVVVGLTAEGSGAASRASHLGPAAERERSPPGGRLCGSGSGRPPGEPGACSAPVGRVFRCEVCAGHACCNLGFNSEVACIINL